MKNGDKIFFLREKVIHSTNPSVTPHQVILVEVPAVYLSPSPADICDICHEAEPGHDRGGKRIHPFTPLVNAGHDIEVHYPDEKVEIRHYVQQGDTANCFKELEPDADVVIRLEEKIAEITPDFQVESIKGDIVLTIGGISLTHEQLKQIVEIFEKQGK